MPDAWLTEALAAPLEQDGFADRLTDRLRQERARADRRRWTRIALLTLALAAFAPFAFALADKAGAALTAAGGWAGLLAPVPYGLLAIGLAVLFHQALTALLRP